MKPAYLIELEDELREQGLALNTVTDLARTAVLVADGLGRRLIESASAQLGLSVTIFDMDPGMEDLEGFEMIVADEALARTLRQTMTARDQQREGMNPALVAVRQADTDQSARNLSAEGQAEGEHGEASDEATHFDGVLTLPTTPAALSAQLSLILYSHRAFARRYQTALEELHLNRRIFRSVTSGISVANASLPDLPLVYVNPAFEVMTGYSLEDVQGKNCRFLQGPQTDQAEVTKLREAIQDGREVVVILKNFRKDGTAFWNEFSLSPIRSRDGQLTHFVGIQTDVTARVEFEAALRESEKLAAVGRLASSIAHEINNPLESVMNLLYLAQHEAEPAAVQRYVAQADKELKRVALITSQSLRFYKQSSRPQEVTGTDLLESVLDLYEGRAANAGLVLERRERAVRSLVGLDSELRQVLNNLVRNALDAMIGKSGTLRIRTRDATDWKTARKGIVFTVADEGTGIAPETLERMFKPFFTTKGIAGTGLGLWISQEIIDRHQGRLRIRSRVSGGAGHPNGTVFSLFLPCAGMSAG